MTKTTAHKLHRELWDWLYHHPSKLKNEWPRWDRNGGDVPGVRTSCFLCECYYKHFGNCLRCPLFPTTYFGSWDLCKSIKTKKKYAKLIRDIVK